MFRPVLAALAVVPLAVAAQDVTTAPAASATASGPTAEAPPLREGVYAGVGLGTSGISSQEGALVAYRIRLGMTRSPRLQLGLEIQYAESGSSELELTDLSATFFPWGKILFVRGGFGFSSIARRQSVFAPGFPTPIPTTTGGNGFNLLEGVGVQLGRSNGVNVTLNVEAAEHRIRGFLSDAHSTETTVSGWLGLEWH